MDEHASQLGLRPVANGRRLTVWSSHATAMELRIFDRRDPDFVRARIPMERDGEYWVGESAMLETGVPYAIGVDGPAGPKHAFQPAKHALPPHAKGIVRTPRGEFRATVIDRKFDWASSRRPETPLDRTVIYEAHVKGMTKLAPHMPEHLRGTYAGLAHPGTIAYLQDLGVTAIQLLPVQQFVSEQRLVRQGRVNYWGYNTLNYFTPHNLYASRGAQFDGTGGVLREFKGMVKLLHEAGLQVFMDVVYNHTAEEGRLGPSSSLRLIDNASYYRQTATGSYVDVTGCGNTVDYSLPAAEQLVIDSLRYWANEVQIDGFRFDLAVALGRDERAHYDREHPLLRRIIADPQLAGIRMIAEPWDVGLGGWQVGNFPPGFAEWNDGFRDRVREFWLSDYRSLRHGHAASCGVGPLAEALAGSSSTFGELRGPLASINLVTAHDGFTLTDLTRYDRKHNEGNGEDGRDGTDTNHSFNHGTEGRSTDVSVQLDRRKSMRNVLGTLFVASGVPMLTAGDEYGRTQRGNNNTYCHDSALNWLGWERKDWHEAFFQMTKRLIRLRHDHAALRPQEYASAGYRVAGSSTMQWLNRHAVPMSIDDWQHASERTLQYLVSSTPFDEPYSRVLVVVHGSPKDVHVTLPAGDGITAYELLWDSASDAHDGELAVPGEQYVHTGMSMRVFRVDGTPLAGIPEAELVRVRPRTSAPTPPTHETGALA